MRYTAGIAEKCLAYGVDPICHPLLDGMMILSERELQLIDSDVEHAAELVGGTLMSDAEMQNYIRNKKLNIKR